jgi:5-methylcytosine-specific restriction endonuclease McrA
VRKRGKPLQYCSPDCREKVYRGRSLANYHGDPTRTERRRVDWRAVLPEEITKLRASDPRYRNAKYRLRKGGGESRIFICGACGEEFKRPHQPGHPPCYCSDLCNHRAAALRSKARRDADPEAAAKEAARREKENRACRKRYAEDVEYRNIQMARARKKAQYPNRRAERALRSALLRGAPHGDLVTYEEIRERDEGVCSICRESVPRSEESLDHVVPVSKGGAHTRANIKLAHRHCNCRKNARLPADLAA